MRIGYTIRVLTITLLSSSATVNLSAETEDSLQILQDRRIDEIVVTGTRNEISARSLPLTVSVVGRKTLDESLQESILPVLTEQVPGLFTSSRGIMGYGVATGAAGGISIRGIGGAPTTGLMILIDGAPQYMGLMGHPIADAYQTMLAERVEVVRGPASVMYGSNAMGGVINIITCKADKDGAKADIKAGYGSFNTVQTELTGMFKKGKFSSVIAASYNYTDGHRPDMQFEQYGGYAKLGYEASKAWKFFIDANITHFNASNPGSAAVPVYDNDSRITRGMTSLQITNNYRMTSGGLNVFYNWGRHKIDDGYNTGGTPKDYRFNSKDIMTGISWYQSIKMFSGNRLTAGVDYFRFGGNTWNLFLNGNRKDLVDKKQDEVAGYIDFRQDIGHLITLDAGIRIDHHSHTGTEYIPQGGITAHLNHNINIKAMASKGFRNPTIKELYMFIPANDELLPEKIMSYEISFSQILSKVPLSYSIAMYYIDGNNIIQTLPNAETGRVKNVNSGEVKNWGVEADIRYNINKQWEISANYSWLNMKYPVVTSPEHKLYADISFLSGRWNLSTGVQYIHGLYTSVNPDIKENFVLWNVRGSFNVCKWFNIFVRGENLLAQRYEINAGYPMPKATFLGGLHIILSNIKK